MKKNCDVNPRLGKVGGEAVIEGVMMRCGSRYSTASRHEDGSISVVNRYYTSIRKKNKFFNLPLVRGVVSLVESMKLSFEVLSISAEALGIDTDEPETKFEKWIQRKFGDKIMNFVMGIAGVLGVILGVFLFLALPSYLAKGINSLLGLIGASLGGFFALAEGILRIGIFVSYILLVSLMPDIRRTFEYHGAEHKSIACYEAGVPLTPENAKNYTRFHPRCGTSFIFVMLILSVLISSLPFIPTEPIWLRLLIKLPLIPVICGLGFEFILYAGKHCNIFTKILSAPGLWMQRITTREPDLSQLEIAITALKASMPEEFPESEVNAIIENSKPKVPAADEAENNGTESDTPAGDTENDVAAESSESSADDAEGDRN